MNSNDKFKLKILAEKASEIVEEINSIQQELEIMGRCNEVELFVKAKDMIDEWSRNVLESDGEL